MAPEILCDVIRESRKTGLNHFVEDKLTLGLPVLPCDSMSAASKRTWTWVDLSTSRTVQTKCSGLNTWLVGTPTDPSAPGQ
ncbi:hypothetical protein RRG08_028195 [Elysia crispata]|uniref:Uncharacterized protein n=1 Tax=Elysia crispata TaxID=231223 RepID=A0AAE1B7V1_9GAST|nr:hypothetical protein RRG08_028195 [Elysia crispata]